MLRTLRALSATLIVGGLFLWPIQTHALVIAEEKSTFTIKGDPTKPLVQLSYTASIVNPDSKEGDKIEKITVRTFLGDSKDGQEFKLDINKPGNTGFFNEMREAALQWPVPPGGVFGPFVGGFTTDTEITVITQVQTNRVNKVRKKDIMLVRKPAGGEPMKVDPPPLQGFEEKNVEQSPLEGLYTLFNDADEGVEVTTLLLRFNKAHVDLLSFDMSDPFSLSWDVDVLAEMGIPSLTLPAHTSFDVHLGEPLIGPSWSQAFVVAEGITTGTTVRDIQQHQQVPGAPSLVLVSLGVLVLAYRAPYPRWPARRCR